MLNLLILIENVTIQERFDEKTNKSSYILLEHKSEKYQPALAIEDENGNEDSIITSCQQVHILSVN